LSRPIAYNFHVVAYDEQGNSSQPSQALRIVTPGNDDGPPVVAVILPQSNITAAGTIVLDAAADDDHGIAKVEWYESGQDNRPDILLGQAKKTIYGYILSWDTSRALGSGSHRLYARAYDSAGHSSNSTFVIVNITHPSDTIPPTVSVAAPPEGSTISGHKVLSAAARDNAAVSRVEFFASGGPYNYVSKEIGATGVATIYGWVLDWDTTNGDWPDGQYQVTALATDSSYNMSPISSPVNLRIQNGLAVDQPPSKPGNLKAYLDPGGGVKIAWSASSDDHGVSYYGIYRNPLSFFTTTPDVQSLLDTGVHPGQTYTYNVFAVDTAGQQSPWATVTITNP
jgi:chitodextrinase